jgi:dihydrofolate reductase
MKISIIVAVAQNGVIGTEGKLPWHLSADLAHFKHLTQGHSILMGRKTFESIGRILPNRKHLVISRNPAFQAQDILVFNTIQAAIDFAKESQENALFVIGGGEIYRQTMDSATNIYLTEVQTTVMGDTYFEPLSPTHWQQISRADYQADEKNEFAFSIQHWEKKHAGLE